MVEPRIVRVDDEVVLEAELASPSGTPRARVVLCHPHPQYGGTMRSIVISALFEALPRSGVACLRFNFRGVEESTGFHDGGRGEWEDAGAARDAHVAHVAGESPIIVAGWSFGADVTLALTDPRITAWLAVAPPLRVFDAVPVAHDPRRKHLVLAEHDEVRPPAEVEATIVGWAATTSEVVAGASHFFVGRTDVVVAAADRLIDEVAR
jgi:alpha/beta superfamily hydrolase